jgi:hypothetical protein
MGRLAEVQLVDRPHIQIGKTGPIGETILGNTDEDPFG